MSYTSEYIVVIPRRIQQSDLVAVLNENFRYSVLYEEPEVVWVVAGKRVAFHVSLYDATEYYAAHFLPHVLAYLQTNTATVVMTLTNHPKDAIFRKFVFAVADRFEGIIDESTVLIRKLVSGETTNLDETAAHLRWTVS